VPPDPLIVRVGDLLASKYRVERVLGEGGMGQVVAARHEQLGVLFALKLMLPSVVADETLRERFLREARAAASLRSENVARVTDFGVLTEGTPYIVMEYLEGMDLMGLLTARGTLPPAEAVGYVLQTCKAMDEAHRNGIVHRDLKPQNLFLTTRADGTPLVKVLDFGISKLVGPHAGPSMTLSAMMMGSPLYMSPEQLRSAKNVDARTDIYSLGVILYQLLCGRPPVEAETFGELAERVFGGVIAPLRSLAPRVSAPLEAVVMRCLAKKPEDRFASVAELATALGSVSREEAQAPGAQSASTPSPLASTDAAPVAVATADWSLTKREPMSVAFAATDPAPSPPESSSTRPLPSGQTTVTLPVRGPSLRLIAAVGAAAVVAGVAIAYLQWEPSHPTNGQGTANGSAMTTTLPPPAASEPRLLPVAPPSLVTTAVSPPRPTTVKGSPSAGSKPMKPASTVSAPAQSAPAKPAGPGGYDPFPKDP